MTLEEKMDAILKGIDTISEKQKTFEVRLDSMEHERETEAERDERERKDRARKDAEEEIRKEVARRDGEEEEAHKKRLEAREEELRKDRARKDGESEEDYEKRREDAAHRHDCFTSARKDAEEAMEKAREDKARSDAEDILREDGDFDKLVGKLENKGYDKDYAQKIAAKVGREKLGESEMERRSLAAREKTERSDSALVAENTKMKEQLAALNARMEMMDRAMKPLSHEDEFMLAKAQTRADSVYQHLGERAPKPLAGMTPIAYRRMLAAYLQKHSKSFAKIRLDSMDGEAFDAIENHIYADALEASKKSPLMNTGRLVPISRNDSGGFSRITEYAGNDMSPFIKMFSQPANYITPNRTN